MPNRLTELLITEVSFVDRPADPNARIELFKRDISEDEEFVVIKGLPSARDVLEEEILGSKKSKKRKKDGEEDIDLEKGSKSSYSSASTDTEDGNMPEMEFTPEQEAYVRTLEDKTMDAEELVTKLEGEVEVLKADAEKAKEDGDNGSGSEEDILKSASPEVVELVKAAEARAASAEEIAKTERSTRMRRDAVVKATDYESIGVDVDELGGLLYDAGEVLPTETMEKLHEILKVANEAADVAALYGEIGKSGEGDLSDNEARLDAHANEIQKADSSLTHEQAYDKALDEHPDLYEMNTGGAV